MKATSIADELNSAINVAFLYGVMAGLLGGLATATVFWLVYFYVKQ